MKNLMNLIDALAGLEIKFQRCITHSTYSYFVYQLEHGSLIAQLKTIRKSGRSYPTEVVSISRLDCEANYAITCLNQARFKELENAKQVQTVLC